MHHPAARAEMGMGMTWSRKPFTRPEPLVAKAQTRSADPRGPTRNGWWMAIVRSKPCLICAHGQQTHPTEAHHPKGLFPRTTGKRISDLLVLQLCQHHHTMGQDALHRTLDEIGWWKRMGVDPYGVILSNLAACRDESRDEAIAFVTTHRERAAA